MTKREEAARAIQAEYEKHYSSDCWPTLDEAESLVDAVIACFPEVVQQEKRRLRRDRYFKKLGAASVTESK